MFKSLAVLALIQQSSCITLSKKSNQFKLGELIQMSNDDNDTLHDRIAIDNTNDITAFTDKIAEQSKDMPSSPVFSQTIQPIKPIPGNFRLD